MNCWNNVAKSSGIRDTMLIKSTIEIPLPIPFSVILSPIHITKQLPATNAATAPKPLMKFASCNKPLLPKPIVIATASMRASTIVK